MKTDGIPGLSGPVLMLAGLALGLSNFMVVLDTTIANVSVAHISGSLAITSSQGTWIITSYSVAEAICVPLTGFLTARFGAVRTFVAGMIGFAVFSLLCGLSTTLTMLVLCRVGQGFCGGPIMPLTQTLLLRIFPRRQQGLALSLWSMTTVVAPVLGPILGGVLSDNASWHWIFFINLPVAAFCATVSLSLLRRAETELGSARVDVVGLVLLVIWVASLQVMLDLGQDRDWFNDTLIRTLGIVAAIGFAVFCAWEVTDPFPAVDLRVFRHRGFSASVVALSLAFGAFFVSSVIIPQWLQANMGYTASWAGYATAFTGVSALLSAPLVAYFSARTDPRLLVFSGIAWLGLTSLLRTHWTSGTDFWSLALPQLLQGAGMLFFFVPVTTIGLAAVDPAETASAAGLMSFMRTMAGAVGTSIATSAWENDSRAMRSELVGQMHSAAVTQSLSAQGWSLGQIRGTIEQLMTKESFALATDQIFLTSALVFVVAALSIWLAPRPARTIEPGAAH